MANLIELHEAAEMLGISPEELMDMRSRNEIFGYRDGSTWKFKEQEIDRVRQMLGPRSGTEGESGGLGFGQPGSGLAGDEGESDLDLDIDLSDSTEDAIPTSSPGSTAGDAASDDDIISLDDFDLGLEGSKAASGIGDPGASDLQLDELSSGLDLGADDTGSEDVIEEIEADDSDSILLSEEELGHSDENTASTIIGEPDDLTLEGSRADHDFAGESDLDLSLGTSDILVTGENKPTSASDTANLHAAAAAMNDDELKLQSDSGSLNMELDDVLESGSKIELADDAAKASSSGFGSAIDLGLDDDELVLGSGTGSDVTSGAGDSGINLANPADSGLSLEDPLEISSGADAESLELGEDDMLELDDTLGAASGQGDDDFMLEPVVEGLDDEGDSGSQVIAIDEELEADEGGMFQEEEAGFGAETAEFGDEDEDLGVAAPAGFATAGAAATGAAIASAGQEAEASYSIWNVLGLFGVVLLLAFTGILLVDLVNNIWSWDEPYTVNSQIMDAILGMLPG